jgi:poly(3-hydroxybutyrate) depolymerase
LFALALPASAQQWQQGTTPDGMTYEVLLPPHYDPAQPYPLLLFLHQLDMGSDPKDLLAEFTPALQAMQDRHPSIVVMPLLDQSADRSGQTVNFGGVSGSTEGEQQAVAALRQVQAAYKVNSAQVYVTGASMGGQGADQMMVDYGPNSAHPIFAAALTMAGTMINEPPAQAAQKLGVAPIIAVHGSQDGQNLPGWDQKMADLDPSFHLTMVQGAGHDVWDGQSGYTNGALWDQLFSYLLNRVPAPLSVPPDAVRGTAVPSAASLGDAPLPSNPSIPVTAAPSPSSTPKVVPDPSIPRTIGPSSCNVGPGNGTGAFSVLGGRIIAPNGSVFIAKGLNAYADGNPSEILAAFPGLNFLRLPIPDRTSADSLKGFVEALTGHGVVVEIEDHPWPLVDAYSGGALAEEASWYASLAAAFKGDPYVWFGTENEPQGGDISTEQAAVYKAIRGTGNDTIVMMEAGVGSGNPGYVGLGTLSAGAYAEMHNVVWDMHAYGWVAQGSTDPAAMENAIAGSAGDGQGVRAAQAIASADGTIPVITGEFGPSTDGQTLDVNGDATINAVIWAVGQNLTQGFAGWVWGMNGPDSVGNGSGLTDWGKVLSMAIASSCQQLAPGIAANAAASVVTRATVGSSSPGGSAIAVSLPPAPAASASELVDDGSVPELAPADTDQSFQQGTQDATSTISAAASVVDAAAQARMQ